MKTRVQPKHTIVIDFETYYTKEYTLTELTTAEYVLDPRFEVIGFAYSLDGARPRWVSRDFATMALVLKALPWEDAVCVAHNAIFDGAILEWQFGIVPAEYFCTMMGSRPYVAPFRNGMSLALVADALMVGVKGDEVKKVIDMHRADFNAIQLDTYGRYCENDVDLTRRVHANLYSRFPEGELRIIDLTIKKYTRPKLQIDSDLLAKRLEQVQIEKATTLLALPMGVTVEDLMSNDKLAAKLREMGVQPPQKNSLTTGRLTWAFAKTDEGLMLLQNHPNPEVRNIIKARLMWKSTLEESRLERFIKLRAVTEWMPVALLYYGAHTGRMSGMDKLNLQNMPREGDLRKALVAPPGYTVVTVDLSQIEARIVATLARQWDLMVGFRNNEDIYSAFASICYGYPVDKKNNPVERFVGKTCILGLGYGMGAAKLYWTLVASAAKYGIQLNVTEDDCARWVKTYRSTYRAIPKLWKQMDRCLQLMTQPKQVNSWQMLKLHHMKCELPNGMFLHYPRISVSTDNQVGFHGFTGNSKTQNIKQIWGGGFLENVSQALAQIIIKRAELKLEAHGLTAALQVHDELVYVVPDAIVDKVKRVLALVLVDPVPWMPDLPLACEVGAGPNYGEAK
jgi:hypothetical protein